MTEYAADILLAEEQREAPARGFSSGYFSAIGCQLPDACLMHCLQGDPALAATHGCSMVRQLAQPDTQGLDQSAPLDEAGQVPAVCKQGYGVVLSTSPDSYEPSLLVLYPPPIDETQEAAIRPAVEALRSATLNHWRLSRENDGLADELLQCYEQVNLIFDVSAEVATQTEANGVRRVLLEKLRHICSADVAFCIDEEANLITQVDCTNRFLQVRATAVLNSPHRSLEEPGFSAREVDEANIIVLPAEYESATERLKTERRVIVSSDDSVELERSGHGTSLWGPLQQGGAHFAIVGVVRRDKPFHAGDMLLLDSTLTFGGHILSNLKLLEQLKQTSFEAVRALVNAVDQKDPYTCGHSERVGFLARAVGKYMGLSPQQLQNLEWGGLLHDIGKIGIPRAILNKPGTLNTDEFALIKNHPGRGFAVLKPVESLQGVLDVVLHHHETPDGQGYPDGLKQDEIPLLARILHIVDTFDALTSTRSYREAFGYKDAVDILQKESGTKFDTQVVQQFLGAWAQLPSDYPQEYERWFGSLQERSS